MHTYLYWANVRSFYLGQSAGFMQVQVRAPNAYFAKQMLIAQYGSDNVLSEANQVPNSEQ